MRKVYIINTNLSNRPDGETERDMVENEKCAAYFSLWNYQKIFVITLSIY
ncbi:hypothetical protein [Bacillus salipaludis]|nr:hypothetical protein [Bacillus salipaludis]